jgi:hypothetical protein
MNRPRIRFTLRQMMIAIAICAGLLAVSRLPRLMVLLLMIGIPLGGYVVDRRRGGEGIRGAMLAGALAYPAGCFLVRTFFQEDPREFLPPLLDVSVRLIFGLLWGGAIGLCAGIPRRLGEDICGRRVSDMGPRRGTPAGTKPSYAARAVAGLERPTGPVVEEDEAEGGLP